ncbi:mitogen-activated protein kinase kinase kinase 5-like [Trichosurus vulpecula]|uniref:mitogen-activated protein kinase kinase kinase 5-like n=1 Tax=Trichosurus vulpecula TaxID=9337 RepID=UPI00186AF7F5|nr:mitogen-activated protein kinase kinase kinase 5-like [Trichosurus vulpecula]
MSAEDSEGITFPVPPFSPPGFCTFQEGGSSRRGGAAAPAAAAPGEGSQLPPPPPPPGSFWNVESSGTSAACTGGISAAAVASGAPSAPRSRGNSTGAGGSSRRTAVAYVINEASQGQLVVAESEALQCLREACEAVGAALETLHFGKLDFGETAVLDRFYNADIAVVEMSDAFRQPSLFYHLGVRESFSMANNIILYCDTNSDSLQSLKEIICQKNTPKPYNHQPGQQPLWNCHLAKLLLVLQPEKEVLTTKGLGTRKWFSIRNNMLFSVGVKEDT